MNLRSAKEEKGASLRVATYNVHKCRGLDGRVRPERVAEVLHEVNADIIALQEIVCIESECAHKHQGRYIAEQLGYHAELGENRKHRGGAYGNLLLSRFPIHHAQNFDISVHGRERRGCLRADVRLKHGALLHVFNIHMGTSYFERRKQARKMFTHEVMTAAHLDGLKIVLGDFNEWTSGLTTRLLRSHFKSGDLRVHIGRTRTYPGILPLLNLDHIYYDPQLKLNRLALHRSRTALIASDHLPLIADFSVPAISGRKPKHEVRQSLAHVDNSGRKGWHPIHAR